MLSDIHADVEELCDITERMILNAQTDDGELNGLFFASQIMRTMDTQQACTLSAHEVAALTDSITAIIRSARQLHPDIEDFIVGTAHGIYEHLPEIYYEQEQYYDYDPYQELQFDPL